MADAVGRALGRSVRVLPTPIWLFMKSARLGGFPIDIFSDFRYYIEDHRRGAFEIGAPTSDVLDVTGRPPEEFETIARRYAALPQNRRTLANWLRTFTQFMAAPMSPGYNFRRYDRELRRPLPSQPELAFESAVWQLEHGMADSAKPAARLRDGIRRAATSSVPA